MDQSEETKAWLIGCDQERSRPCTRNQIIFSILVLLQLKEGDRVAFKKTPVIRAGAASPNKLILDFP